MLTGEIHHAVIIDGIRVGSSVCLIARTIYFVIGWAWVPYESSQYWTELLKDIPAPAYVVCDGQKGMLHAIGSIWPNTTVQRCRFHAWSNIRTKLTMHPESEAGKQLLDIGLTLLNVHSKHEVRRWKHSLQTWYRKHQGYIDQRTISPSPKPGQRKWHYTHDRVRSAYRQLHKITDDLLRSSYRPHPELPRNTNYVEGGINSQLRTKLKDHRGMSFEHQTVLVERYLYSRSEAAETKPYPEYSLAKTTPIYDQKPPRKTF